MNGPFRENVRPNSGPTKKEKKFFWFVLASAAQCPLLPIIDLGCQPGDLCLLLLRLLGLAITGLASSQCVPGTLHGDGVVGVLDDDGRQGLVTAARVDAGHRRVTATAARRVVARLGPAVRRLVAAEFNLVRLLSGRVLAADGLLLRSLVVGVREEREPVGGAIDVARREVGRDVVATVQVWRLIVD